MIAYLFRAAVVTHQESFYSAAWGGCHEALRIARTVLVNVRVFGTVPPYIRAVFVLVSQS